MNSIDEQLERLLRAADRHPVSPIAPRGLETEILAAWRAAATANLWSTPILLRGLFVAGLLMALSFLPLFHKNSNPLSDYQRLTDSTLPVSNPP